MKIQELKDAQADLVNAAIAMDSAIADIDSIEDSERQKVEGYQRTLQSILGELAIMIAKSERKS